MSIFRAPNKRGVLCSSQTLFRLFTHADLSFVYLAPDFKGWQLTEIANSPFSQGAIVLYGEVAKSP